MIRSHSYSTSLTWTGNQGKGTSNYNSYERSYTISTEGKTDILGSADPAFRGDASKYNPEEMLLASLSSCHMLWYLHLCSTAGITVTHYEDNAEGIMEEHKNGSGRFTEVILKPIVKITDESQIEKAEELHSEANKMCFIANSCNFPVKHVAEIKAV
ncbi:OsmC family protein [Fulvivirga sediminis]|uniref:OsmC family protein n=1 Tax=Fulvivirga sediminis TaxID=2803949 RepID=A0A937F8T4_9BACT|nr:OsmC family protein [Fulvivirga sediminis]MBL3656370.1 OsmC family protein [Fulvivirga sediminis]